MNSHSSAITQSTVVAIDLGGTKIAGALVTPAGHVVERRVLAVDRSRTREQIIEVVRSVVHAATAWRDVGAVGVAIPGIYYARTGDVWAPNVWGPEPVPIARQIAEEIPAPVFIDSDRTAYVLGEHWRGVARGRTDVAFVAIGTGIGVGIMIEGNLCRGAQDIAGAAGWFALNREWNAGYATKGCWESEAAGPAIAAKAGVASVQEVIDRSSDGDANATRVLEDAAGWIGMGIANIVSLLNPQIVVLGGGVMQFAPPFMIDRIRSEARRWAQPIAIQTTAIELSSLGADAGLLGAARIAYLRLGDNRE